ncbi:TlpA family protein disulfide reductase [Parabacteroides bouchesdurhonensis]|uniref:TlpA family protein disulfide reductase n=1 Tax=Parabacteroides bouchesdurhonensis TaxID=1936995 RepID=UPI000C81FD23|nr:TlpA disulfide reductase family protein [Parabacteroides bouchesdurhonensis]
MKKRYSVHAFLIGFAGIVACSSNPSVPENEFLIEGKLTNVPDSSIIELRISDGRLLKEIARDTLINGTFMFRDTIATGVRELYLRSRSKGFPGTWMSVWVAPGEYIKVSGTDKLLQTWTIESDIPEQREENLFVQASFPEKRKVLQYSAQEYDIIHEMYGEHAGDEEFEKNGRALIDSLRKLEEPLKDIIQQKELDYMKTAPVSSVWLNKYRLYAFCLQWNKKNPFIPEIKALYARMSEADKETVTGKEISEYMNLGQEVNIGDEMVDGDLYDPEGNIRHLSEFKGRYILLDFWSMGCGPCIQSIPEMEEISEMYKDKLSVVSINGDSKEDWIKFIADRKMTGNQWNELLKGRTGLMARYQVIGIPHYVLISPEGIVAQMWSGYAPGSLKGKLKEAVK